MLFDVWRSMEDGAPARAALRAVVEQAAAAHGDHAVLRLLSEDGSWVRTVEVAHRDPGMAVQLRGELGDADERTSSWACWPAVSRGRTVHLGAVDAGRLLHQAPRDRSSDVGRHRAGSVVIAPVAVGGAVIGALGVVRERRRPFQAVDVEAVEHLAHEAGLAIEAAGPSAGRDDAPDHLQGNEGAEARDEAWWRSLIERSSDLVLVIDPLGCVTYANPAAGTLLGVATDALVGRAVSEILEPLDGPGAADLATSLAAGSGIEPGRYLVRTSDGGSRTIEVRAGTEASGAPGGWIVNGRDVTEAERREAALRRSERHFRAVVSHVTDIIVMLGADGRMRFASPAGSRMLGYGEGEVPPHVFSLVHPDDRDGVHRDFEAKVATDEGPSPITFRIAHRDGSWRHVEAVGANRLDDPDLRAILVTLRDVTERVEAEAALARSEDHHRRVVERSPEATAVYCAGRFVFVNPAGKRILGTFGQGDVVGRSVLDFVHPDSVERIRAATVDEVDAPTTGQLVAADGSIVDVELVALATTWDGEPAVQVVVRDITDHNRSQAALIHQATHDALTGLPNRTLLLDRLGQAIARMRRSVGSVAVLFLDLDRFKVMNDALGHEVGDEILKEVAARLLGAIRPSDTVARIGGDEFVVLVEDLEPGRDASDVSARIEAALAEPILRLDHTLYASASIGVVIADRTSTPGELLRDADSAMYLAKEAGRGRSVWFTAELRKRVAERLDLEVELRLALERGELQVVYQPEVRIADGSPQGAEALVRWAHPERGLLGPDRFISVAEETGLIVRLGRLVLEEACAEAARWDVSLEASGRWMGVNVSAAELAQPDFVDAVLGTVARHGLPPGRLCLEITESVLMWDPARAAEALVALRSGGVTVAIDDFGTGYSSLNYLKRFPVDFVKVDREFVSGLGVDPGDAAIVRAVIDMSHALGLAVVAEGVETVRQRDQLGAMGCDFAQGWHFGHPVSGEVLRAGWSPTRPG